MLLTIFDAVLGYPGYLLQTSVCDRSNIRAQTNARRCPQSATLNIGGALL